MADRCDYYFRMAVSEAELDLGFELLERADRNLAADLGVYGIISGAAPSQHAPVPDLSIDLSAPGRAYDRIVEQLEQMPEPTPQRPRVLGPTITVNRFNNSTRGWSMPIQQIRGNFAEDDAPAPEAPEAIFGYPVRQAERIFEPPRIPRGRQNFDGVVRDYMAMSEEERAAAVREQRAPHITMSDRQTLMQTFQRIIDEETLRALRRPQPANPPLPPPTTANESSDNEAFTEILNRYFRRRTR